MPAGASCSLHFFPQLEKKCVFGTYHDLDDICANTEEMETPSVDLLSHIQGHLYLGALATLSQANKAYRAAVRSTLSCRRMLRMWARMRTINAWIKIRYRFLGSRLLLLDFDMQRPLVPQVRPGRGRSGKSSICDVLRYLAEQRPLRYIAEQRPYDFILAVVESSRLHGPQSASLTHLVRRKEAALNRYRRKAKSRGLK